MREDKTRGNKELKSLKSQLSELTLKLVFWMVMITFIISFCVPLLGETLGHLYLDLRDYFVDAPTAEKAGLTFFGLF